MNFSIHLCSIFTPKVLSTEIDNPHQPSSHGKKKLELTLGDNYRPINDKKNKNINKSNCKNSFNYVNYEKYYPKDTEASRAKSKMKRYRKELNEPLNQPMEDNYKKTEDNINNKKRPKSHYRFKLLNEDFLEPYKEYIKERREIEEIRKRKELEMKYVEESIKLQEMKFLNDIRTKYQGYDFSRQKPRGFFLSKYISSKHYKKEIPKKIREVEVNYLKNVYKDHTDYKYFQIGKRKYYVHNNKEVFSDVKFRSKNINLEIKKFINDISKGTEFDYFKVKNLQSFNFNKLK